jgi:hypothetical protein
MQGQTTRGFALRAMISVLLACLALAAPSPASAQVISTPADSPQILWEITNRFAPFEAYPDPEELFARFSLSGPREGWQGWMARAAQAPGGIVSPYARHLRGNADMAGDSGWWDSRAQVHGSVARGYLRGQGRVRAWLWSEETGPCTWKIGSEEVIRADCSIPVPLSMPLAGLDVTLIWRGGEAVVRLAPRHQVIVGLGDSYGSGEGNPDRPTLWRDGIDTQGISWLVRSDSVARPADWVDRRCHRSFFNWQSMTALAQASADPHVFVSFLHYACTGAEIFDGLIAPQNSPGVSEDYNAYSQINAAVLDLCAVAPRAQPLAEALAAQPLSRFARRAGLAGDSPALEPALQRQRRSTGAETPRADLLHCPQDQMRAPDLVLWSFGGNDIGFGDLVQYFLAPGDYDLRVLARFLLPDICPGPENRAPATHAANVAHCNDRDRENGYHSGTLTQGDGQWLGLGTRMALGLRLMGGQLGVRPDQVLLVHYPDPLRINRGSPDPCGPTLASPFDVGPPDDTHLATRPWRALSAALGGAVARAFELTLDREESFLALRQIDAMRAEVTALAERSRAGPLWGDAGGPLRLVCETRDAFVGHGWWQGSQQHLPGAPGQARYAPRDWQAYRTESGDRAVRTGNDSALIQSPGARARYGTFHPNLLGHALMADGVIRNQGWGLR